MTQKNQAPEKRKAGKRKNRKCEIKPRHAKPINQKASLGCKVKRRAQPKRNCARDVKENGDKPVNVITKNEEKNNLLCFELKRKKKKRKWCMK